MFSFLYRDARDESNIHDTLLRRKIIFYINFTSGLFEFTFILRSWRHCSWTEQNILARSVKKKRKEKKRTTFGIGAWLPGILPEVDKEKRAGKNLFHGFASLTVGILKFHYRE